ncbi:MAG TPA: antitoxin Xre/MbcA/ParS toxin-binding domain-containing protein [Castellaniella sp.]|nr:antitoxin Xre/MbcA/ParS toxin-binding domain-containing protein [Castellaniella sp.]
MFAEALRKEGYSAYRARLHALLGISRTATDQQIHDSIVNGFPAQRLVDLCEQGEVTPIERDRIIPLRTLKTRLSKDQRLTVEESDRLFRAAHITAMAQIVFGNKEKAKRWLSKPKDRFSGAEPLTMLSTVQGTRQVEEMLLQIAEGYAF